MIDFGQLWFKSGQFASITTGVRLIPRENPILNGIPLVISRGQAEAFFLKDSQNQEWILKKFLPGRNPDSLYINALQSLIPRESGFESGYRRIVLNRTSLSKSGYYSTAFANWIENSILMPKIKGGDWAYLADKMREGTVTLSPEQRLLLCRDLSEKVLLLETHDVAHRDLSSTNILIDTQNWQVHLIDWDSLYSPSLSMPPNTTYGTNGYIAPFVRVNGVEDPRVTWRRLSDRFGLAILNIEFLTLDKGSTITGDGGIFEQMEIYNRGGPGLTKITADLHRSFPNAVGLLQSVLSAATFNACPGPEEWISFSGVGGGFKAPSLKDIYDPTKDFDRFLHNWKPVPPRPAPKLSELENPADEIKKILNRTLTPGRSAPKLGNLENPADEIKRLLGEK